jgi:hypothetical protein
MDIDVQSTASKPLTVARFIEALRLDMGWECEPGSRITNELTEFAQERVGSTRDIIELLIIFKMSHGLPVSISNAAAIEALP